MIAHIDMDSFFASCEEACNPSLRSKPLVICGRHERGVVTASNKIAKYNYGIKTAMSGSEARRISGYSKDVVFMVGDLEKYIWFSKQLNAIILTYTPIIEPYSIDELFFDMKGCPHTQDLYTFGRTVKQHIRESLSLPSSIGIGPNRFLAKMGTKAGKPDGLVVMTVEMFKEIYWPQTPSELWGIGSAGERSLHKLHIDTVGTLAQTPVAILKKQFGKRGVAYHDMANGQDDSIVGYYNTEQNKSFSNGHTMSVDSDDPHVIDRLILLLSSKVSRRMRAEHYACRTIGLSFRASDYHSIYRKQRHIPYPTNEDLEIYSSARALFHSSHFKGKVRAIQVFCGQLIHPHDHMQGLLFQDKRERKMLQTADHIRKKYGEGAIVRASLRKTFNPLTAIHFQTTRRFQSENK